MTLYTTARQELGIEQFSTDDNIAREGCDLALGGWTLPAFGGGEGWNRKAYKKHVEREAKALRKRVKDEMKERVKRNPSKYGIVFPATLIIGWIVSAIIGKLIEWLVSRWMSGGEQEILAARLERGGE